MVERVIDNEGIKRNEFFIRPSFDDDLAAVKESMQSLEEKMDEDFRKAAKDLKLEMGTALKLEYVAHHGYHYRITLSNETVLRKNDKYTILDTVKGGVRFVTERLSALNKKYDAERTSYEEQQQAIVDEVIRVARERIIFFFKENFRKLFSWK